MFTKCADGVEPLAIDKKIKTLIRKEASPWDPPEPGRYTVGIRNQKGEIYRLISMDSLGPYVGICEGLKKLELEDEIKDGRMVGRFGAIFRPVAGG